MNVKHTTRSDQSIRRASVRTANANNTTAYAKSSAAWSGEREAVELILQAIAKASYELGEQIARALDPASSSFYEGGQYHLRTGGRKVTSAYRAEMYADWVAKDPIVVLED
jgi:enolase